MSTAVYFLAQVFLRETEKLLLDDTLHRAIMTRIINIQRWMKATLDRRRYVRMKSACIVIQVPLMFSLLVTNAQCTVLPISARNRCESLCISEQGIWSLSSQNKSYVWGGGMNIFAQKFSGVNKQCFNRSSVRRAKQNRKQPIAALRLRLPYFQNQKTALPITMVKRCLINGGVSFPWISRLTDAGADVPGAEAATAVARAVLRLPAHPESIPRLQGATPAQAAEPRRLRHTGALQGPPRPAQVKQRLLVRAGFSQKINYCVKMCSVPLFIFFFKILKKVVIENPCVIFEEPYLENEFLCSFASNLVNVQPVFPLKLTLLYLVRILRL